MHYFFVGPVQGQQHIVRQASQLDPVIVHQVLQGGVVARRELIQHILVRRPGGIGHNRLQVRWQRIKRVLVDNKLEHGARLMPAGVIVVFGHLVHTQGQVVVGAHPLGGVNHPGLQGGVDFTPGYTHRGAAGLGEDVTREARYPHFQALQIRDRIDFPVEPAGHLYTGTAAGEGNKIKRRIGFPPELQPTAIVQPGIGFLGVHAKGYRGEED